MPTTFADLGVPSSLVRAMAAGGITAPFPVQAATLPDALAGRDVCGRAPTGSGKTLAFGLALLVRAGTARPRRPRALVLAPTRELAAQIQRELAPLAAAVDRTVASVYGGVGFEPQRAALRRGVDVLVACPGRLVDLQEQGAVRLDGVQVVVVDEADRMSDMGFLPVVRRLLDATPAERQTMLFSATLEGDVGVLSKRYQRSPVRHEVGPTAPDIRSMQHRFWDAGTGTPVERLALVRVAAAEGPTIVFCRTRHRADRVARQLDRAGVVAAAIHGGRSQGQRDRALADFATGRVPVLVATDVAARGIHVDGVACVVHHDPPADAATYVHRSGRTARAGATGVVVTLVAHEDRKDVQAIATALEIPWSLDRVAVEGLAPTPVAAPAPRPGPTPARSKSPAAARGKGGGAPGSAAARTPRPRRPQRAEAPLRPAVPRSRRRPRTPR